MAKTRIRPNADDGGTGGYWTITGGSASVQAALSDGSDATYVRNTYGSNEFLQLGLGTLILPAGNDIAGVSPGLRAKRVSTGNLTAQLAKYLGTGGDVVLSGSVASVNGTSVADMVLTSAQSDEHFPDGSLWTQTLIDALEIYVQDLTSFTDGYIYEAYADVYYYARLTSTAAVAGSPIASTSKPTINLTFTAATAVDADQASAGWNTVVYGLKVFNASQYQAAGFNAATSTAVWSTTGSDSVAQGDTVGTASVACGTPLPHGTYRAYVRAKWDFPSATYSAWGYGSFTVYAYLDTVEYRVDITPTNIASLSASATKAAFATLNNKVYFGSEYNALRSYDGSTVASLTATPQGPAPAAGYAVEMKRRIFAAGKATDPALLEYTAIDSPGNWAIAASGAGAIRPTGKDSGGECTGMIAWSDVIMYFSYSRVHAITTTGGPSDWVNRVISSRFGCVAPKTLQTAPNAVIFLSGDGVMSYGTIPGMSNIDGSGFINLSEPIQPTLARINYAYRHKACGAYFRQSYYLSVPLDSSAVNNATFVYRMAEPDSEGNWQRGAWTKYSYGVSCFQVLRGDEEGLYAGTYDGKILHLETGSSDNGAAISLFYRLPPLRGAGSSYAAVKHFRRLHISARANAVQNLTITPYSDDISGQPVTLTVSQSTDVQPIRVPMSARGRSLGLDLLSSGDDQDITISEVTVTHSTPKMR